MTEAARSGVKVKGSAVKPSIEFVRARFGDQGVSAVAAALSPGAAGLLTGPVVPSGWYDIEDLDEVMTIAAEKLAGGDPGLIEEMGASCSRDAVLGVYRQVFEITSTQGMIENTPLIWKRYYNAGSMRILDATATSAVIRLTGFPYLSRTFCRRVSGWMKAAIELTGGVEPEFTEVACRCDGAPWCEWQASWR